MKAVRIHSLGDSNVLTLEETPRPEPGDGEVLIRVRAAGVNPVDCKTRSGQYRPDIDLPLTLGRDVSGVIEGVGKGVTGFKVGDEVFAFLSSHSGGYAEYAVAKIEEIALKPETIDHVHAAAVPLAAITAWQALFDEGKLQRGQRVLIHGAGGGVGHFAVQFAREKGAVVVATGRREDFDLLRRLGVDELIDYQSEKFEEETSDIDLVIDLVAGETQRRSWKVLKDGGTIVSTLAEPSRKEAAAHHAQAKVFMAKPRSDELKTIARMIDDGKVTVVVDHTIPLAEARRAHDELEQKHSRGKLVLTVA